MLSEIARLIKRKAVSNNMLSFLRSFWHKNSHAVYKCVGSWARDTSKTQFILQGPATSGWIWWVLLFLLSKMCRCNFLCILNNHSDCNVCFLSVLPRLQSDACRATKSVCSLLGNLWIRPPVLAVD